MGLHLASRILYKVSTDPTATEWQKGLSENAQRHHELPSLKWSALLLSFDEL